MNGIICIDKPSGFTSFDVVAKLRHILKMRRIGHGGTLDPLATGLLPVYLGAATKALAVCDESDKSYEAGFMLGMRTDTLDITGATLGTCEPNVTREQLLTAIKSFSGEIMQIPPMYSAVQVGGQRLYKMARKGIEVERPARQVRVYSINLTEYDENSHCGSFRVSCSKGTYIRSIVDDMGSLLGCGAVLTSLRRTAANGFDISEAHSLEQVSFYVRTQTVNNYIIPTDRLFQGYPEIHLDEIQTKLYRNGCSLDLARVEHDPQSVLHRIYSGEDFLGLAESNAEKAELRVYKNLA